MIQFSMNETPKTADITTITFLWLPVHFHLANSIQLNILLFMWINWFDATQWVPVRTETYYLGGQISLRVSRLTCVLHGSSLSLPRADRESDPAPFSAERRRTVMTKAFRNPVPKRWQCRQLQPNTRFYWHVAASREQPKNPVMEKHGDRMCRSRMLPLLPESPSPPELDRGRGHRTWTPQR